MSLREAATYLLYIAIFAAVVAWAYVLHAPRQEPPQAATHAPRLVSDGPVKPLAGSIAVSVVQ
jgi:hypothetical protein